MNELFAAKILSVAPIPPGFEVRVTHTEWLPGQPQKTTDLYEFPVIGWATVQPLNSELVRIEPVFLWDGEPTTSSQYRGVWSNLKPDPGEPKQTVGIKVIHPKDIR
ncbi:hypothetical protein AB0N23_02505 [Streptomyces sp. NPDC052644]